MKVEYAFECGNYYAWGRQDATAEGSNSEAAWEFASAWKVWAELFHSEQTHYMTTIQDAYDTWTRDREFTVRMRGGMWKIVANPHGLFEDRAQVVPVPIVPAY